MACVSNITFAKSLEMSKQFAGEMVNEEGYIKKTTPLKELNIHSVNSTNGLYKGSEIISIMFVVINIIVYFCAVQ